MKTLLFFGLICISCTSGVYSQVYSQDFNGKPLFEQRYTNIEGSPFLMDQWVAGSVTFMNKKTYPISELNYDMVEDLPMFKNKNAGALYFADPVIGFSIEYVKDDKTFSKIFRNGFPAGKGTTEASFFEILADGKTQLLKRSSKSILDNTGYGSATKVKSFSETVNYYIFKSQLIPIKKDKKAIITALGTQPEKLGDFIKANKLDLKSEEDLAKLIAYYNSI